MKRGLILAAPLVLLAGAAGAQLVPPPPGPFNATPLPPPGAPGGPPPAPQPPPAWVPQAAARIEVLNKIDAVSSTYTVRVGQSVQVGSLTVAVQACDVRPPDQPADAAAFLTITDNRPEEPGFRGWMLAHEPWVAMLQSPVYDVRVIQCQS